MRALLFLLCALAPVLAAPSAPVSVQVDVRGKIGPFKPVWAYFGYDEPNKTDAPHGRKLLGDLAAAGYAPVYLRAHLPCPEAGYTEDASGQPIYDWTILDRIFDAYAHAGAKPFVGIGCRPPKDYRKWAGLVYEWVRHSVERYGKEEVLTWYWEVWNEPDIPHWRGTAEEYNRLYDFTADAVKRALPGARVGGPATTGPSGADSAAFLQQFLEHCAQGANAATGQTGAPLDFISYHAKGRTELAGNRVRMGLGKHLQGVARGMEIVTGFPQFRGVPVILSEPNSESCAACAIRTHPQNTYRDGALYPSYTAAALAGMLRLADRYHVNLEGMVTSAFDSKGQPYFAKPIANLFRMAGQMRGVRLRTTSTGAAAPSVDAMATLDGRDVAVLVWNYDDDVPASDAPIRLSITGLPGPARRALVRHYRIDANHSNAFAAWKKMGSPANATPAQYARLEAAGQLEQVDSPRWLTCEKGTAKVEFALPRHAVSLVQLSWKDDMQIFDHVGVPTEQQQPGEMYVAATKVWVTDPATHPHKIEYLRYEPDTPVKGPVKDLPHMAYQVDNLESAMEGAQQVLLGPFQPTPTLRVVFVLRDGAVIEYMENSGDRHWFKDGKQAGTQ